jgi:hypothetical protein
MSLTGQSRPFAHRPASSGLLPGADKEVVTAGSRSSSARSRLVAMTGCVAGTPSLQNRKLTLARAICAVRFADVVSRFGTAPRAMIGGLTTFAVVVTEPKLT